MIHGECVSDFFLSVLLSVSCPPNTTSAKRSISVLYGDPGNVYRNIFALIMNSSQLGQHRASRKFGSLPAKFVEPVIEVRINRVHT